MEERQKVNILFIGNPGVGKSTLLNGLIGQAKFKSGVVLDGTGMTKTLQIIEHEGCNYIDTPGLDDDVKRKQCAEEINEALKQDGLYYICFIITLESGRFRPADRTTISLVLDCAKQIGGKYSIVLNKLEPQIMDAYTQDPNIPKTFLFRGLPLENVTHSLFFFDKKNELFGHDNIVPNLPDEFFNFVKNAPFCRIDSNKVDPIKENEWEVKLAQNEKIISDLHTKLAHQRQEFEKLMQQERERAEKQYLSLKQEQTELARKHEHELAVLRAQVTAAQSHHQGGGRRGGCLLF